MRYCTKCNKTETICGCKCPNIINSTTINSDVAGRDGLSAKDIAKLSGEFTGTTDKEFAIWNRGPKGDKGDQMYTNADW